MKTQSLLTARFNPCKIIHVSLFLVIMAFQAIVMPATGTPLNGSYTIDATLPTAGTNFQSFTAFASSINLNGVSGNVIATVVAGTGPYHEQVIFNNIAGAGPTATITLEGSGELITALTTTTNRHVIRLTNCQYFTINNLNISRDAASTGGFYGIHLYSTGNHITISNCSVDLTGTNSTLYGAYIASGSETSILETGDFHDITITGNTADGGGYGASIFGLVTNLASHIIITNNTFLNYHSNGVYLRETDSAVIAGNTFDKSTSQVTSCNAIQIAQAANIRSQIYNNSIRVTQTANGSMTQRGIYLFNGTGHKVYNNVIHNILLTSGNFTAIEIRTPGTAPEIYFNTISIDNPLSTTGNLYGIKEELSNTNAILRNNMVSISQPTSSIKSALVLGSTAVVTSAFNSDFNDLWVPGDNVAQKGTLSTITYYPTLSNWQTTSGQDSQSISDDPVFVSPTFSQPTNILIDNAGTPIAWILTDITGSPRGITPDIGAYEFSAAPPATPDTILGNISVCENSSGVNYSVSPVTGATSYTWTVTGATLVSGQGTPSITVNFTNTACNLSVVAVNNSGNSNAATLTVSVNPAPVVNLILPQDTVCLNWPAFNLSGGTPLNGTYTGTGVVNTLFDPLLAGEGDHTITYTYEAGNGCSASATDIITVDICTGIAGVTDVNNELSVYPSPGSSHCIVKIPGNSTNSRLALYDQAGNQMNTFRVDTPSFLLNLNELSDGIYLVKVTTSAGIHYIKRIIVLHNN